MSFEPERPRSPLEQMADDLAMGSSPCFAYLPDAERARTIVREEVDRAYSAGAAGGTGDPSNMSFPEEPIEAPPIVDLEPLNAGFSFEQLRIVHSSILCLPDLSPWQDELVRWLLSCKEMNPERTDRALELARTSSMDIRTAWARLTALDEAAALQAEFSEALGVVRDATKPPRPWWMKRFELLCAHATREMMRAPQPMRLRALQLQLTEGI